MLNEEKMQGVDMVDTEHLTTLVVAMPKASEKDWLETYPTIGEVRYRGLLREPALGELIPTSG